MQPLSFVSKDDQYINTSKKVFSMIDNYIYIYHTDTLLAIPTYPESITDSMAVTYSSAVPFGRSAPIFSYTSSGPRSMEIQLSLHRDMMNEINTTSSKLNVPNLEDEDYIDRLVRELQSIALPRYADASKMVNPPQIAIRFGSELFCKGVVNGQVGVTYSGPILRTDKYALISISFSIQEIDAYDASIVRLVGSNRGQTPSLQSRITK